MEIIIKPIFTCYSFSRYSEYRRPSRTLINKAHLLHYIHNIINNSEKSFNSNLSIGTSFENPLHLFMMKLSFVNYDFRNQYIKVICNKYSQSDINKIYQNEELVLSRWAKSFNQVHRYFKIIQFQPKVDRINYNAECLMINLQSKDIKNSVLIHNLEYYEGPRLALIMQKIFNSYVQNDFFRFNFEGLNNSQGPLILASIRSQEKSLSLYVKGLLSEYFQLTGDFKGYKFKFAKSNTKVMPLSEIINSVAFWQTELDQLLQRASKTPQYKQNRYLSMAALRSKQSSHLNSLSTTSINDLKSLNSALSFESLSVKSESSFASSRFSSLSSTNSSQSSLFSKELISQRRWLMKTMKREHRWGSTILFIGCSIVAIIAMFILAIS